MKLPTISDIKLDIKNRGFLIPEIMMAFSLMTLFLTSAIILSSTMQSLHDQAIRHLENLEFATHAIASSTLAKKPYGNDSQETFLNPFTLLQSDYINAWGRDNCNPRLSSSPIFDSAKINFYYPTSLNLGAGNTSTDIEVRNGIAYLTADSASASSPDFYIIDMRNPTSPVILSSLNTGPGLAALEVAGPYAYVANMSSVSQLQVIDIRNRSAPFISATLKLPLPFASSTAPASSAIFYSRGIIYLGTEKWNGNEFAIIDVSQPSAPRSIGGFETNTLINDIYVRGDDAYLAASDSGQMRILDIQNPVSISQRATFSPSGWETQVGKSLSYFEGKLSLGRTTGGFNNTHNYEFFLFSTTSSPIAVENSKDVPGGIYGILLRPPFIYFATRSSGHEFQIWDDAMSHVIYERSLGFLPHAMACDGQNIYFATGDQWGISILTL